MIRARAITTILYFSIDRVCISTLPVHNIDALDNRALYMIDFDWTNIWTDVTFLEIK